MDNARKIYPHSGWLKHHIVDKKMNSVIGYIFLSIIILGITWLTVTVDQRIGPGVVAGLGGICLVIAFMKFPYFGFYFTIAFSTLVSTIDRLLNIGVPSGTFIELFTYLLFVSVVLKYEFRHRIDLDFWRNPITVGLFILFSFYIVELFNPNMFSALGWVSFFRKQLSFFVFYYLCYAFFNSRKKILYFVHFNIALTTLAALYACKQQWFGYAGFEKRAIAIDGSYALLFQGGFLRKFSVFSDPATSGVLFASVAVLCIILAVRETRKKARNWFGFCTLINLLGYSYSGTRTATLMVVSGIALYVVCTLYEKRTVTFAIIFILALVTIITMPFQNMVTNRIRTTFQAGKDASASLRDFNRHAVQPYIQDHPIGGGIFTCGFEGPKYNHGHYLEMLQPDSGYMKTLAEEGAIGLLLMLIFYFICLRVGLRAFYRLHDPKLQSYYIALTVMVFAMMVGQYSQMVIYQYPIVLYFYAILIIFIKLAKYDKKQPDDQINPG
jgi:putative inorganic carbon (hco3(-)) transporter